MKEPHSSLSKMHTIIKCNDHNKHKLNKHWKPKITEQELVTLFEMEWTHPLMMFCNYSHLWFKHSKGLWGRLHGTCHQSIWNKYIILCLNEMHSTVREVREVLTQQWIKQHEIQLKQLHNTLWMKCIEIWKRWYKY